MGRQSESHRQLISSSSSCVCVRRWHFGTSKRRGLVPLFEVADCWESAVLKAPLLTCFIIGYQQHSRLMLILSCRTRP